MPPYRPRYRTSFINDYFPPGLKWLLISNTAVFLIYFLGRGTLRVGMTTLLALYAAGVVRGLYIWQLFTYMFLHGGITHLLFNMLTLWFFGTQLERDWGTRRFLKYYFLCGIAAGVCVLVANMLVGDWATPTIGASGAIFGVLVAFGVLYPNQTVLMNFLFPIKAKYMVIIYAAIELLLTFGPNTGVSTIAHLGGMAFGYVYLKGRLPRVKLPEIGGAYRQWKLQRAKKKFQVYMRKHGRGPWVN
jgi:membrane associated rhomboid family serine protease